MEIAVQKRPCARQVVAGRITSSATRAYRDNDTLMLLQGIVTDPPMRASAMLQRVVVVLQRAGGRPAARIRTLALRTDG